MYKLLDLFLGDPVYDDRKRVVGRDFGVKNMIAIGLVLYIGNLLMCEMKPKSGKRKMKGGVDLTPVWWTGGFVLCLLVIVFGSIILDSGD